MSTINHPFEPLYDKNSEVLILGSFPSVISRKENFYYANKQNRFWKIMANILNADYPNDISDKKRLLLGNKIALWDVIASCEINKSYDSSIKNVKPNDVAEIINKSNILKIGCNGDMAFRLYNKYIFEKVGKVAIRLPSTSSANAAYGFEKLRDIYSEFIKGKQ